MRLWKKVMLALLVLVLIGTGLPMYVTWLNQQRDYYRQSFAKRNYAWILRRASEKRIALRDIFYKETEPLFEPDVGSEVEAFFPQDVLSKELEMFHKFQYIRREGYIPIWRDYRYILKDVISGEEIDPFLQAGWHGVFSGADQPLNLVLDTGDDVLFSNILGLRDYNFTRFESLLFYYKLCNARVVVRDNEFLFADEMREGDYDTTFQGILLRNEAARYNWAWLPNDMAAADAILRDYGVIMRRVGAQYFPEYLDTGERIEFPAQPAVAERVLRVLNKTAKEHGKDFVTPEGYYRMNANLIDTGWTIGIKGHVAKEFLELYGIIYRWDEANQQYEMVSDE